MASRFLAHTHTRDRSLWIAVWTACLIPVPLWLWGAEVAAEFHDVSTSMAAFGKISGLIGMSAYSLNMILGARFKFLDRLFNGINKAYQIHHTLGIISILFLLAHPLLLASSFFSVSFEVATAFLMPSRNWPKNFGIFALDSMIILMIVAVFAKFRYQLLKFLHQLIGVSYAFGVLHVVFTPNDLLFNPLLRFYLYALIGAASFSYLYRTIFGAFLVRRFSYLVSVIKPHAGGMVEIVMVPAEGRRAIRYEPGQFVFLSFADLALPPAVSSEVHPFSLSSNPTGVSVSILSKSLGDYTAYLPSLTVGALAFLEGPYGRFSYNRYPTTSQIWVAGGSGIAPFLGMLRHLDSDAGEKLNYRIDLYFSVKSRSELAFLDEFSNITTVMKTFRFFPHVAETEGFLTAEKIEAQSITLRDKDIFVCGPPPMMKNLTLQFLKMGVPRYKIHTEEFQLLR